MRSNITPLRRPGRPQSDTELGMAWFNSMNERQRLQALREADTDCPAVAWAHWQQSRYCEGAEHA
jgi:hypothetical protein